MHDPKRRQRLVASRSPTTQREEDRRVEAIMQRLLDAADDEAFEKVFKELVALIREADLKVVK